MGYHLVLCCAENGFVLIVAADQALDDAASDMRFPGTQLETMQTELATCKRVDRLVEAVQGRPVDALLANAGHGPEHAFLSQDFDDVRPVIGTNSNGALYLLQCIAPALRARSQGRTVISGLIASYMPGTFQAIYHGTTAFMDSLSQALRNPMKDTGVTVSLLMPGAADTDFSTRADLLDTKVGADDKAKSGPAVVAKADFKAMMDGKADVFVGLRNKLQAAMAKVMPAQMAAEMHCKMAEPGVANNVGWSCRDACF